MNEINEIWKPIIGYESRYIISNKGEVKSLKRNKVLKKELRRNYWSVQLYDGNKFKHFLYIDWQECILLKTLTICLL